MSGISAVIDSNVAVAMLADEHQGHAASVALFTTGRPHLFAMAAHSYAETYSTLTRGGSRAPFRFTPDEAWEGLESLRAVTVLIGLTPSQTLDAIRKYAADGGIGPRLYDALIGEAAVVHGVPAIITWNTRHMAGLFPGLEVTSPATFSKAKS